MVTYTYRVTHALNPGRKFLKLPKRQISLADHIHRSVKRGMLSSFGGQVIYESSFFRYACLCMHK